MDNKTETTDKNVPRERALGDCDYCGHSVIYHAPLFGCAKWNCGCEEFH